VGNALRKEVRKLAYMVVGKLEHMLALECKVLVHMQVGMVVGTLVHIQVCKAQVDMQVCKALAHKPACMELVDKQGHMQVCMVVGTPEHMQVCMELVGKLEHIQACMVVGIQAYMVRHIPVCMAQDMLVGYNSSHYRHNENRNSLSKKVP